MSVVDLHRSAAPVARSRPVPAGYGLLAGTIVSLGLWIGLIWMALAAS